MMIRGSGDASRPQSLCLGWFYLLYVGCTFCLKWRQIATAAPASVILGSGVAAGRQHLSLPISPAEARDEL